MLKENGSAQVQHLTELFNVSAVTIRKDLKYLDKRGIATRTYGGAILNDTNIPVAEKNIEFKQRLNIKEKCNIANAAAELVEPGDSIILDSGTTTYLIAEQLQDKENITVVSNDLNAIHQISHYDNLQLLVLGGTLRRKNMSLFGSQAEHALKDLHVDKLILGVDGFHMEKGITTHFEAEAILNRMMCNAASEIIVVTDSSKFNKICLHKIVASTGISTLVTDDGIPVDYRENLMRQGVNVIVVEANE